MKQIAYYPGILFLMYFFASTPGAFSQQAGWRWQKPYLQGNDLNSIVMNGVNGWVVGDMGLVMHTSNSGYDWEIINLETSADLNCIYMNDIIQDGWIVGAKGLILYTADGGQTWKKQLSGTTEDLYSITATGGDCPWICGHDVVLHSYNKGEIWDKISTPVHTWFWEIDMKDCDEIWVCGNQSLMMSTNDHGVTWQIHPVPTSYNLMGIDIVANGDYRACGNQETIIKSADGGESWLQEHTAPFISMYAVDTKGIGGPAYAVGDKGHIIETLDGGTTWTEKTSPTQYQLNDVCFQALYHAVYSVGCFGQVLRKDEDAATEFEVLNKQPTHFIMDMDFITSDTGWAVGGERLDDDGNKDGIILYTTDGGTTWEQQLNRPIFFNSVDFINSNEGWAVGSSIEQYGEGVILHTINGGKTWTTQSNPIIESVDKVFFLDKNNGWVVSNDWWGQIAHTTNGGQTWTSQTNPTKNPIVDVFFINPQKGWAVGMDSTILRTTDGGLTWLRTELTVSNNWYFRSVFFIDELHGWTVGVYGVIMLTSDGGITWQEIVHGNGETLLSVFFSDALNGWAVGDEGTVLRTIDGGYTWFNQYSGIRRNLLCTVQFIDKYTGWLSGEGGTIKRTGNGGFWNEPGTYLRNNLNLTIKDFSEVRDTLTVDIPWIQGSGYQLTGIEVMLDSVMHSSAGDLEISISHQGMTQTLVSQVAGPGADFLWVRFTDNATNTLQGAVAPFSGNHKPYLPLSIFNGSDPEGAWILTIRDQKAGNTGTLRAWGVKPVYEKLLSNNEEVPAGNHSLIMINQNVPNPFDRSTRISWSCSIPGYAILRLYNSYGSEVGTLFSKQISAGDYAVDYHNPGLSPGLYYYQLNIGGYVVSRKCIVQ